MTETKIQNSDGASKGPDIKIYLKVNLVAWAFVLVLAAAAFFICGMTIDDVTRGVWEFIFVVLGGGFTLVSFLDYTYEKYNGTAGKS